MALPSASLRAFKDDRAIGSLLDFKVEDDHVLIGDFCNAHEGALELRAGKFPGCWSKAPMWEGKGTVFANEIKYALPSKLGDWKAARLFRRDTSEPLDLCGAVFWHAGAVGERSEDAAQKIQALVAAGGDFGENVETEAVLSAGWRFIGRYSWQYYCAGNHAVENLRLLDDDEAKMDMDGVSNHIIGGPVCTFVGASAYWDSLWPILKADVAAGISANPANDNDAGDQDDAPLGLFAVPGGGGVAGCFGSQEYCFARICFVGGEETGKREAVMLVCYTYNCPETLLAVQVEGAPVQKLRPPEGVKGEQLLEWVDGLSEEEGLALFESFPASHAEELVKAVLRHGAVEQVRRANRLGMMKGAAQARYFCAAVAQGMVGGKMGAGELSGELEAMGLMPAKEALAAALMPQVGSFAGFQMMEGVEGGAEGRQARVRGAVGALLERGLDPNARVEEGGGGWRRRVQRVPLLYRAAEGGDAELVRELLGRGAEATAAVTEEAEEEGEGGGLVLQGRAALVPVEEAPRVPLRAAAESGNAEVLRALLEAGGEKEVDLDGVADVAVNSFVEKYESRVRNVLRGRSGAGEPGPEGVVAAEAERLAGVKAEGLTQQRQLLDTLRLLRPDLKAYAEGLKGRLAAANERAKQEAAAGGVRVFSSQDAEREATLALALAVVATG